MQISRKAEKEGKPHGKNPPPKREMKRDAWMDGVIKIVRIFLREKFTQDRRTQHKYNCRTKMDMIN